MFRVCIFFSERQRHTFTPIFVKVENALFYIEMKPLEIAYVELISRLCSERGCFYEISKRDIRVQTSKINGSFLINGEPSAVGIRAGGQITNNTSYFLPVGVEKAKR